MEDVALWLCEIYSYFEEQLLSFTSQLDGMEGTLDLAKGGGDADQNRAEDMASLLDGTQEVVQLGLAF